MMARQHRHQTMAMRCCSEQVKAGSQFIHRSSYAGMDSSANLNTFGQTVSEFSVFTEALEALDIPAFDPNSRIPNPQILFIASVLRKFINDFLQCRKRSRDEVYEMTLVI